MKIKKFKIKIIKKEQEKIKNIIQMKVMMILWRRKKIYKNPKQTKKIKNKKMMNFLKKSIF